jgi:WD40 repeat protein
MLLCRGKSLLVIGLALVTSHPCRGQIPFPSLPLAIKPRAVDSYGDPLPEGAVARLGTSRFWLGGKARCLAFSPDRKLIAAGGNRSICPEEGPGRIFLWDAGTGKLVRMIVGFELPVRCLAFSPDGRTLAASSGSLAGLWDVATGKIVRHFPEHESGITLVGFLNDPDQLVSGDPIDGIQLWDVKTGRRVRSCKPWKNGPPLLENGSKAEVILDMAISPDAKRVTWWVVRFSVKEKRNVIDFRDEVLRISDAATGKVLLSKTIANAPFQQLVFSPDGRYFATEHESVDVWVTASGKKLHTLRKAGDDVGNLVFSPDGQLLASADEAGHLCLWNVHSGKKSRELTFADSPAEWTALAFSRDSQLIAVGNSHVIRLWKVATGRELIPRRGHRNCVGRLSFSPDGKTLTSQSTTCRRWSTSTWKQLAHLDPRSVSNNAYYGTYPISPDGTIAINRTDAGDFELWHVTTRKPVCTLKRLPRESMAPDFSPDGKRFALVEWERDSKTDSVCMVRAHVYETATGKLLTRMRLSQNSTDVALSPSGDTLAWEDKQHHICLGDLATGKIRKIPGTLLVDHEPADRDHLLMFSGDDRSFAAVSAVNGTVYLWHLQSGKPMGRFTIRSASDESSPFACVALSPDGRLLASGHYEDGIVRVWETASGQERGRFRGHAGHVASLAFSPDGRYLASGSADTTVLVWDLNRPFHARTDPRLPLTSPQLARHWANLAGPASQADGALWSLVHAPQEAIPLFQGKLRPVRSMNPQTTAQLLADLDSPRYAVRRQAAQELENKGDMVETALQQALQAHLSLEARQRVHRILERIAERNCHPSPQSLRQIRTVEALERIGNPQARRLLESLAAGAPAARLTLEARTALDRLSKRPSQPH